MFDKRFCLYLVTQRFNLSNEEFSKIILQAVKGGVKVVQLREKNISKQEFVALGKIIKPILKAFNVPLIINDQIEVALELKAEGLHIGQSDALPIEARRLLGKNSIIGLSVETMQQCLDAETLPIDYIAASPVYLTPTKTDTGKAWGLEGLKELRRNSSHYIVAIGGINMENAKAVRQAGADGIAVVSAIFNAHDPFEAAQNLSREIDL